MPSPSRFPQLPLRPSLRDSLLLAALSLVFTLLPLGMAPLFDKDEGAFCEATREMLVSGNYLMTYLNGEPRYDKPILIYWLQALSATLFGLNEFALRLPSALAAIAWSLLVYRFGLRHFSRTTGLIAAVAVLTSLQSGLIGKAAIADSLLNLLLAGAMFALFEHYETRRLRSLYVAVALMALGALTKGPVAVLIPLLATLAYTLSYRRFDLWRISLTRPWAWLIFLGIALPWPIAAYLEQGNDLIYAWVMEQTVHRAVKPLEGHGGGFFYYVPVVLLGTLPFTLPLLGVLRSARRLWASPLERFLLCWFAAVFVMFTFVGTKLPHYMVYGYTPLFLLIAERLVVHKPAWSLGGPVLALATLLFILPGVSSQLVPHLTDENARAVLEDAEAAFPSYYAPVLFIAAALALSACIRRVPATARAVLACCAIATMLNFAAMPAAARLMQHPVRTAALLARDIDNVVMYDFKMPSFLFYRGKLAEERAPADGETVVCRVSSLEELERLGIVTSKQVLFQQRGIVLARVRSAIPSSP